MTLEHIHGLLNPFFAIINQFHRRIELQLQLIAIEFEIAQSFIGFHGQFHSNSIQISVIAIKFEICQNSIRFQCHLQFR